MAAQSWSNWLQDVINAQGVNVKQRGKRRTQRINIAPDESFTLPDGIYEIRVVAGKAWICSDKKDLVAHHGQRIVLMNKDGLTIVVPLGQKPLVIDAYSRV